jgi:putative transposase
MSIPERNSAPQKIISGQRTFHITSSTLGKQFLLQSDRARRLFVTVLYEYRAQNKFRLHEFVAMPNHFHVLITVNASMTIERATQFIKGGFAFRAHKELGLPTPVWQRGFSERRIIDVSAAEQARDYIRNNPVVAGIVKAPEEYAYSSAFPGYDLDPLPQGLKPRSYSALIGMAEAMP